MAIISFFRLFYCSGPDGSLLHKCDCCPIHFKTAVDRTTHMAAAHKEKLTCKICDRSFRSRKALNGHIGARHKGPKKGTYSQRSEDESDHHGIIGNDHASGVISRDRREKKFECKYCGKKYICPTGFDKHIVEHGKSI